MYKVVTPETTLNDDRGVGWRHKPIQMKRKEEGTRKTTFVNKSTDIW